jgi:hypothetical protein
MDIPKDFRLTEMKKHANGRTTVEYDRGSTGSKDKTNRPKSLPIHGDFSKCLTSLESYLAQFYELDEERVSLTAVKVKHYNDGKGESIQILGNYSHPDSEQEVAIKTAPIQSHLTHYGFEKELKAVLAKTQKEAASYVFKMKSSQLSIEDKAA